MTDAPSPTVASAELRVMPDSYVLCKYCWMNDEGGTSNPPGQMTGRGRTCHVIKNQVLVTGGAGGRGPLGHWEILTPDLPFFPLAPWLWTSPFTPLKPVSSSASWRSNLNLEIFYYLWYKTPRYKWDPYQDFFFFLSLSCLLSVWCPFSICFLY